jgi:hypothetical protein
LIHPNLPRVCHYHLYRLFLASNLVPTGSSPLSSIPPKSSSVSAKACAIVSDGDDDEDTIDPQQSPLPTHPRNLPPDGTSFSQISLGSSESAVLSPTLPAYGYWNAQFYQSTPGYVRFELEMPRGASLGVYARRNALPTHTNYDLMEVLKGTDQDEESRSKRASKVSLMAVSNVIQVLLNSPSLYLPISIDSNNMLG